MSKKRVNSNTYAHLIGREYDRAARAARTKKKKK